MALSKSASAMLTFVIRADQHRFMEAVSVFGREGPPGGGASEK
jgi:hypothetical protein